jgi:hypothetical protein
LVSLVQVAAESVGAYPEYRNLNTRGEVQAELTRCKSRLEQFATQNVAVRSQAAQLRDEEPFDVDHWRGRLAAGEVVLDYCFGPSGGHAILLCRARVEAFQLPVGGIRSLRELVEAHLSPEEPDPTCQPVDRTVGWIAYRSVFAGVPNCCFRENCSTASCAPERSGYTWLRVALSGACRLPGYQRGADSLSSIGKWCPYRVCV